MLDIQAFKSEEFDKIDLSIPQEVIDNLKNGEAVVARKKYYMVNLYNDYCYCHISDDIRTLDKVIMETQPDYWDSFNEVMWNNNALIHYNMFMMTWPDFDEYCQWLFTVLAEVEKRTDISHYTPVQMRIYGYMAERLFNVYLHAKKFKLKHHNVIWFNDDAKNPSTFTKIQQNFRGCASLFLVKRWRKEFGPHQ